MAKFRKVYLVVQDNKVFSQWNFDMVNMYRTKDTANRMCQQAKQKAAHEAEMIYNKNKPIPQHKVHAFYLVHESYFDDKENK